jgi:hypothetical protein
MVYCGGCLMMMMLFLFFFLSSYVYFNSPVKRSFPFFAIGVYLFYGLLSIAAIDYLVAHTVPALAIVSTF